MSEADRQAADSVVDLSWKKERETQMTKKSKTKKLNLNEKKTLNGKKLPFPLFFTRILTRVGMVEW